MVKILGTLVAVIVIAAGGFFGFEFYVHQRVLGDGNRVSHARLGRKLLGIE